jgi:nucleolin
MEDGLTPAQQEAQADPTDASATVGADALAEVAQAAERTDRKPRTRSEQNPPNRTLYIGNLYYEVTGDQLQKVFSRFGEVESVKVIYDNRGLSRGFVEQAVFEDKH